jgi:hypothetical protein
MIGGQYGGMEREGGGSESVKLVKWARNAVIRVLCGELDFIPPLNSHGPTLRSLHLSRPFLGILHTKSQSISQFNFIDL